MKGLDMDDLTAELVGLGIILVGLLFVVAGVVALFGWAVAALVTGALLVAIGYWAMPS